MLKLYHYYDSPCAMKVRFALQEKQLPWEGVVVDLFRFEQASEWYRKLNPLGVVPTLDHDGKVLAESSFINEYLEDVFPDHPLRPTDLYQRAWMRFWVKQEDDVLHPSIRPATFNFMIKKLVSGYSDADLDALLTGHPNANRAADFKRAARAPIDHSGIAAARTNLERSLDLMERRLNAHDWLAGEMLSLADIACAPIMDRIEMLEWHELIETRPGLKRWWTRIRARPAFTSVLPPPGTRMKERQIMC